MRKVRTKMEDHTRPEPDGLYEKYRVFKEPTEADEHPVPVFAHWKGNGKTDIYDLEEVEGWTFVLKPDTDPHARVALAAYAASVEKEKPELANDLLGVLYGI